MADLPALRHEELKVSEIHVPKKITLYGEQNDELLALRRLLFKHSLTITQLFCYFGHLSLVEDPELIKFLQGAKEYKKNKFLKKENYAKMDADTVYQLIEDKIKNTEKEQT